MTTDQAGSGRPVDLSCYWSGRRELCLGHHARYRKLVRAGWTVLHDVAVPGSRANGDHLLIGPPGVFLVDSKAWHGHITRPSTGPHGTTATPSTKILAIVRWEAQQLAGAIGAPVLPMVCVHDTKIPGTSSTPTTSLRSPPPGW
jgi:Nuclease-related domain